MVISAHISPFHSFQKVKVQYFNTACGSPLKPAAPRKDFSIGFHLYGQTKRAGWQNGRQKVLQWRIRTIHPRGAHSLQTLVFTSHWCTTSTRCVAHASAQNYRGCHRARDTDVEVREVWPRFCLSFHVSGELIKSGWGLRCFLCSSGH